MKNHYETLGIPKDASKDAVEKAFRKRARQTHPDRGGDVTEFNAVHKAALVLRDDARRKRYDETGDDSEPNKDNIAATVLSMAFQRAVQTGLQSGRTAASFDVLADVRKQLNGAVAEMEAAAKQLGKVKEFINESLQRLKGDKDGLLPAVMRTQLAGAEREETEIKIKAAEFKAALKLLEAFSYDCDKPAFGSCKSIDELIRDLQLKSALFQAGAGR